MSELAHLYSKLNQVDRAIDFCEQILAKMPDDYETRIYISKLYKKNKNYEKARQNLLFLFNKEANLLNTAEELFSVLQKINEPEEILNLYYTKESDLTSSIIYSYVGWAYYMLENNFRSEEYFKKAFELDETNIVAGSRVAEILLENGDYEDAKIILNNLLKYSENDKVFYILGEIAYIKSDYDSAINYYLLAIKHNDRNTHYYYKLAGLYVYKGFLGEAQECYNKAIYLEPDNLLYRYTLAYLYFISGKYSSALSMLDDILKRDKAYKDAIVLKLQILLKEKNLSGVIDLVDFLSKYEPKDERIYYVLSLYYSELNFLQKAISYINSAINLNSNSCEYKYELVNYYFKLQDYEKALNKNNEIIAMNDKFIQSYIMNARLYMLLNDYSEAANNISKALKLDMNVPEIYYLKGQILQQNKEFSQAIENYKIAISMSPKQIEYYYALAKCYYFVEDYDSAYQYFKEASELDISSAECRYYMAKCCEHDKKIDLAITNYAMAKRLSPNNIEYIKDYARILYENDKKKQASIVIKSSLHYLSGEDKKELKHWYSLL